MCIRDRLISEVIYEQKQRTVTEQQQQHIQQPQQSTSTTPFYWKKELNHLLVEQTKIGLEYNLR